MHPALSNGMQTAEQLLWLMFLPQVLASNQTRQCVLTLIVDLQLHDVNHAKALRDNSVGVPALQSTLQMLLSFHAV